MEREGLDGLFSHKWLQWWPRSGVYTWRSPLSHCGGRYWQLVPTV